MPGKEADSKKRANVSDCCWKTQAPRSPCSIPQKRPSSDRGVEQVDSAIQGPGRPRIQRSSSTTTRDESAPSTSLILPRNCSSFNKRETPTSTWRRSDHNPSSSIHRWPRPTRHWVDGNDVQSPSCKVSSLGAAAVPWLSTQLNSKRWGPHGHGWCLPTGSTPVVVRPARAFKRRPTPWPHACSTSARDQGKQRRFHAVLPWVKVSRVKTGTIQRSSSKCPHASGASRTVLACCWTRPRCRASWYGVWLKVTKEYKGNHASGCAF